LALLCACAFSTPAATALTPDGTSSFCIFHSFFLSFFLSSGSHALSPSLADEPLTHRFLLAGEALLELKLAFNATVHHRLTSWRRSDPNPCVWEGISCSVPDLRVQSMCVPPRLSLSVSVLFGSDAPNPMRAYGSATDDAICFALL
jgi:hypothetical protein